MSPIILAIIALIILITIAIMIIYNILLKTRLKIDNAWQQINILLNQRFELIPDFIKISSNYMTNEENAFKRINAFRTSWNNLEQISEIAKIDYELSTELKTIMVISEKYPSLTTNEQFSQISEELRNIENKISFSTQFYNDIVTAYNEKIEVFPYNVVCKIFKFDTFDLFKVPNNINKQKKT